ncbi:MAG: bifunctional diguanylate cyclase/phosphodiesterase [Sphingomonas bacterium]|nr:EAL domain-containing protein [Sphingomonas bacterium]MDB5690421.1 bifunctional diguanylate cyclase/phosphodiesterase [Sphingomonas bacterium]
MADEPAGGATPIFLLSFRHRDELAAAAERAGWQTLAARRAEGVERRFVASGASIAVVDARGAFADGMEAARLLADAVEANAGALLVLLSRADIARLGVVFESGATDYLASPFGEAEFGQALRFVARSVERLAGGRRAATGRAELIAAQAETWRWQPGETVVTVSPALADRLGHAGESVSLRRLFRDLDRAGRRAAHDAVTRLLDGGQATAFAHTQPSGRGRIAHHLHIDAPGGPVVGLIEDLDRTTQTVAIATRDPLTGIGDGPALRRWLDKRLHQPAGRGARCVLLLLAVNRFETINRAFGNGTGDALLQGIARRIERLAGSTGRGRRCVARIAGAEFAIGLAPPTTIEEGEMIAAQIVEAVARPFVCGDQFITIATRIGVAAAGDTEDGASLLRRASTALADAKGAEAGAVRVLDARGEAQAVRDSSLETDLRLALDADQIGILFQPQVAVTGGAIVGVEALARWRHPRLGELGAATLFAAAERSDYLVQLSRHVQRKAMTMAAAWPEALAHLRVAVNVTAADIAQPGFASHFLDLADQTGLSRRRITVEVTESGLIEDLGSAAGLLAELRAAGLRVAIDDFGTGYSSLAYLKALPLDYLKIDQHLSKDIAGSSRDRIVVRGVIEMARSLGLTVIAEGVETEVQLALLAGEGCALYQGFLCAPPLTDEALASLVAGQARR